MSDYELVLELCRRLRLNQVGEYNITAHRSNGGDFYADSYKIEIGWGEGYSGFYVKFEFDSLGNVLRHGVWE